MARPTTWFWFLATTAALFISCLCVQSLVVPPKFFTTELPSFVSVTPRRRFGFFLPAPNPSAGSVYLGKVPLFSTKAEEEVGKVDVEDVVGDDADPDVEGMLEEEDGESLKYKKVEKIDENEEMAIKDGKKKKKRKKSPKSKPTKKVIQPQRNLYEILECSPNATRTELKRQYVTLARKTHPDANILSPANSTDEDFNEIASAWRILSDSKERKRYDRALRAAQFTNDIERLASDFGKKAGPTARDLFEKVAVPIITTTTAKTVAAFAAGGNALKNMADTEQVLLGKILELEERAQKEEKVVFSQNRKLSAVLQKRLQLSLHTPDSNLTALDAMKIFDDFNVIDSKGGLFRHTLTYDIAQLQAAENEFETAEEERILGEDAYQESVSSLKQAKINAVAAVAAEKRAHEALQAAKHLVQTSKERLGECSRKVTKQEQEKEHTISESERLLHNLKRNREIVRRALLRKQELLASEREDDGQTQENDKDDIAENVSNEVSLTQLEALREEESRLTDECTELEENLLKVRKKASKLRARMDSLSSGE